MSAPFHSLTRLSQNPRPPCPHKSLHFPFCKPTNKLSPSPSTVLRGVVKYNFCQMLNPFPLPCTGAKVVNKEPNADSLGQRRLAGRGKTAVSLLPPDKEAPVLEKQKLNRRQKQLQKRTIKKPLHTTKRRQKLQQVVKARQTDRHFTAKKLHYDRGRKTLGATPLYGNRETECSDRSETTQTTTAWKLQQAYNQRKLGRRIKELFSLLATEARLQFNLQQVIAPTFDGKGKGVAASATKLTPNPTKDKRKRNPPKKQRLRNQNSGGQKKKKHESE